MSFDFFADTYETEVLKTLSVWSAFQDDDLPFRPAARIRTPHEQMVHQCVSEDNWMKTMLGIDAGMPQVPAEETRLGFLRHYAAASQARLGQLREKPEQWYGETATFFDVPRSRSWILLRRLTHSAHHRAQLVVFLRLLGRPVYSTYGPTADTGGLPIRKAPTIYRYESIEDLLRAEAEGGRWPELPGPGETSPTERPDAEAPRRPPERIRVRTREAGGVQGAWSVVAHAAGDRGSIIALDSGAYRGEGMFAGWSQEQLAAEYARLAPPPDEPQFDVPQLG